MPKLTSLKSYLNQQLADPEFAKEYSETLGSLRFAFSLTALRELRGMTQTELAEKTGIRQPVIARYESGTMPNAPNMQKLAAALNGKVIINADGGRIEPIVPDEKAA